jgi:hypothetical protein
MAREAEEFGGGPAPSSEYLGTTLDGETHMRAMGFDPVDLTQPMAPHPRRVSDRLSDIFHDLEAASEAKDWNAVRRSLANIRVLMGALDAWDAIKGGGYNETVLRKRDDDAS